MAALFQEVGQQLGRLEMKVAVVLTKQGVKGQNDDSLLEGR
jgi:hypothetical protein